MMGDGDICDGLSGRYGGGISGGSGLGFNLCDFIAWMFGAAAAVGTVAVTSFALASGGDGSPYRFHANQYQISDFGTPTYEIPDYETPFPDGYPFPNGVELPNGTKAE
jgi:hypothetical protein